MDDKYGESKKYNFIKRILEEWNPIGVPEEIADVEYLDYIPCLLQNAQDKEKMEKQLVTILKYMGFNNNYIHRKMVQKEIKEIASKIYGFTSG